jgi:hypothetical protein
MLKQIKQLLGVCVCLLMLSGSMAYAYDYPFADPYVATVLGTPAEYAYKLPKDVPLKYDTVKMFPKRKLPGILWNLDELRYSYLRQKGPAPLIFLIAGTGASFESAKMKGMQKVFYQAGYHVISLSSPTHPNFIVAASTSGVPGNLKEDSFDLYQVMQSIWEKLQKKMEVTDFFLTGYSLGAAESAFIAKFDDELDEKDKVFNFRKVLLINPPVSLYNSVQVLDKMLEENIPGGLGQFGHFYDDVIKSLTEVYVHGDHVDFNDQFLYRAFEYRGEKVHDKKVAALIGTDFRISSANMVFVSDVLTKAGYVVPKGIELGRHDSTVTYLKTVTYYSFVDYFKGLYLPYFQAQDPSLTEADLITQTTLQYIEDYLRNSPKLGLIHNEDDIILLPGEIDYLRSVFGNRAQIFPRGGHCGNMSYPDNVTAMLDFFQAPIKN